MTWGEDVFIDETTGEEIHAGYYENKNRRKINWRDRAVSWCLEHSEDVFFAIKIVLALILILCKLYITFNGE